MYMHKGFWTKETAVPEAIIQTLVFSIYWALEETIPACRLGLRFGARVLTRTLHVGDALLENLLQDLGVLELLLHLGDDGRGQLLLLTLLDLALVAGPGVEDGLGLGGEGSLLLELESLGLELRGFLAAIE